MLSLVDKNPMMENEPQKRVSNNSQEAVELLGLSSSDSLDSPLFSQFQAPKKRKIRFKKPFRSNSRTKNGRTSSSSKSCKCEIVETLKIFSYFALLAIVGALLWYVMTLSTRIQELQAKFADIEAGNKNTPEALHVIHSNLKQLDSNVTMLTSDVRKNIADIENITAELKLLKDVAGNLKDSIAAAPAIEQLPKDMHALSESVANFGSKMNALESNVKELKDQQSNLQTTTQSLYGDLDVVKVTLQELSNSSDPQMRSSASGPVKDMKLSNAIQEATQHIDFLQGQLTNVLTSINLLNTTFNNKYADIPEKVETAKEAIIFFNNETHSQNVRLNNLENFVHSNLSLRIDECETDRKPKFKELDEHLNKSISDIILNLINKGIFHNDPASTLVQPLEKTHDVLVLLAALLKNFNKISDNFLLNDENATETVKAVLLQALKEFSKEQGSTRKVVEQTNNSNVSETATSENKLSIKPKVLENEEELLEAPIQTNSTRITRSNFQERDWREDDLNLV